MSAVLDRPGQLEEDAIFIVRAAIAAARPDPELRIDEWAEHNMVLPKSGPTGGGDFRLDRTPPARRVHQVLSPGHPCKRVVARVASQMFKTQTAINWICAVAHQAPANILALEPTDGLAKRLSARVSQAIRAVPVLRGVFAVAKSRDKRNTTQAKDFQGDSTLYINTAGASANLAEITARYVFIDEVDRMESSVDGEGDPVELAEARATQFQRNCKFYEVSSPTIKGFSKIDALYEMGTQEAYHVPCPHCGHLHELVLENFHYERDPDTGYMDRAWFACPQNGCVIEEHHKAAMLPDVEMGGQARWVASSRGDGETISFTLSAFYMPVGAITWLALARQHARAKDRLQRGDHEAMQVFYNTRLGLSYQNSESTTTAKQLQDRAEPYAPRVVPERGLVLTMAVDTQVNRLEVQIEAWGPGLEHWVVDYLMLHGSPSDPPEAENSVWRRLDNIRRTPLAHASGSKPILISAYGIDAGGANTQDVYNYGMARKPMGCTVLHGANRPNRPIMGSVPSRVDVEWGGTKTEGGVELWTVGTDVAKDYLFSRFALSDGAGAMHFHETLPAEWFEGLVVEQPRVRYAKGRAIREWIKPNGARNEPLDLSVYNLAMAYQLGLHRWSAYDWQRLRDKLVPPNLTRDLFAPPAEAPAPEVAPEVPRETPEPKLVHTSGQPIVPTAPPSPPAPPPPAPMVRSPAPAGRRFLSRGIR